MSQKLSKAERQILVNQYRILSAVNEDSEYYDLKANILEQGYTGRYSEVFTIHEEIPEDICDETDEILNMYRRINNAITQLSSEEKDSLNLEKLKFEGFDGNNDPHYHYMTFMVENMDLWQEYNEVYLNSHSQFPLTKYRKMLEYQKALLEQGKYDLDKEDLVKMIERL